MWIRLKPSQWRKKITFSFFLVTEIVLFKSSNPAVHRGSSASRGSHHGSRAPVHSSPPLPHLRYIWLLSMLSTVLVLWQGMRQPPPLRHTLHALHQWSGAIHWRTRTTTSFPNTTTSFTNTNIITTSFTNTTITNTTYFTNTTSFITSFRTTLSQVLLTPPPLKPSSPVSPPLTLTSPQVSQVSRSPPHYNGLHSVAPSIMTHRSH